MNIHRIFRKSLLRLLSLGAGILRCCTVQVQMRIAKRELWRIPIVPLREESSCQPTLAFIVSGFTSGIKQLLRVSEMSIGTYVLLAMPLSVFAVAFIVAFSGVCC